VQVVLRSFQVSNHKSIRDEVDLLLIPAYDRGRPVVPVAAVFGANASGKSNLLDALSWLRSAVLDSYRSWEIDSGIPRCPYRLDAIGAAEPSSYAVDIAVDGVQYLYGVSLDDNAVREEWLYAYPHAQKRIIFERHGQELVLGSTVGERRGRAEVLSGLMRPNALLLSVAAQADQAEALPVYRWFREGVTTVTTGPGESPRRIAAEVSAALAEFPEFVELIRVADLGIADVVMTDAGSDHVDGAADGVPAAGTVSLRRKRVVFLHGERRSPLEWDEQSDGTRSWVRLLMSALSALAAGAVLTVDEIDASLHPRLTARLIELFRSPRTNQHTAQLVFTTHDATLLGTSLGEEILRRDEIWFVEKTDGVSALYPLSDFHPRKGENRERRYLGGSYGAVPMVFTDSLVDGVLKASGDSRGPQA
jgi:uncharacterized protein